MSKLEDVIIYAWVGEDELGSGKIGIKHGMTTNGLQPLVTTKKESALKFKDVMQVQSEMYGKEISLCKFIFRAVEVIA